MGLTPPRRAPRRADWRARLCDLIHERRTTPFVWGGSDCCLWAADAALAMTGHDFAAPLRGYGSQFGALRALVRLGYASVSDFLASILPQAPRARCGDVVLLSAARLDALMIADGRGAVWGQDAAGLVRLATPPAATFWSV